MSDRGAMRRGAATAEILGAVYLMAATALVVVGGVLPSNRARTEVISRERALATASARRDQLDRTRDELERRLGSVRGQLSRMPEMGSPRDTNTRLSRIAEVATAHGVAVDEVAPRAAVDEGPLRRLPIRLAGSADFAGFAAFLRDVHARMPDLVVASFEISQNQRSAAERHSFGIDFSLYAVSEGDANAQ